VRWSTLSQLDVELTEVEATFAQACSGANCAGDADGDIAEQRHRATPERLTAEQLRALRTASVA